MIFTKLIKRKIRKTRIAFRNVPDFSEADRNMATAPMRLIRERLVNQGKIGSLSGTNSFFNKRMIPPNTSVSRESRNTSGKLDGGICCNHTKHKITFTDNSNDELTYSKILEL